MEEIKILLENNPEVVIGMIAIIGLLGFLWGYASLTSKSKKGHRYKEHKKR